MAELDPHIYNRIDGERCDFTEDQFENPNDFHEVEYEDLPSSREEAATLTSSERVEAMRAAFEKVTKVI
jgi:hypothetical protein